MRDHLCQGMNPLWAPRGEIVIKVQRSAVPLDNEHGYIVRYRGGATIYLNRTLYDDQQCAALERLFTSSIGEAAITWWDGELVQMDAAAVQPLLPIGQPVV